MAYNIIKFVLAVASFVNLVYVLPDKDAENVNVNICFNNCNGHGDCIDYTCHCYHGYHGDDCSTTFINDQVSNQTVLPILSVGTSNLTSANYSNTISQALKSQKKSLVIVGISSLSCFKCIRVEREYYELNMNLQSIDIPFYRVDADGFKSILNELNIFELPSLIIYRKKGKPIVYNGMHHHQLILNFIYKLIDKNHYYTLTSVHSVSTFLSQQFFNTTTTTTTATASLLCNNCSSNTEDNELKEYTKSFPMIKVIGLFSDPKGSQSDEYQDFLQVAIDLKTHYNIYFAAIVTSELFQKFIIKSTSSTTASNKVNNRNSNNNINIEEKSKEMDSSTLTYGWITIQPSICVVLQSQSYELNVTTIMDTVPRPRCISFDQLYNQKNMGDKHLFNWILRNTLPLVSELTPVTFLLYEQVNKPMLMLFLDMTYRSQTMNPYIIGGKSNGISNQVLIEDMRSVAKLYENELLFVYLDGVAYPTEMKKLGLFGGKENLPLMAFNTKENLQLPFPKDIPINKDTIKEFCSSYIYGKLKTIHDINKLSEKWKQKMNVNETTSISHSKQTNTKNRRIILEQKVGILEFFGDEHEIVEDVNVSNNNNESVCTEDASGQDSHTKSCSLYEYKNQQNNSEMMMIIKVTRQSFNSIIMCADAEDNDILLLLYSTDTATSGHFIVYYKRLCKRLYETNTSGKLQCARMDVTLETPPIEHINHLLVGRTLPLLVLFPAEVNREPPYRFYSGTSSIKNMMEWIAIQVTNPINISSSLPHLNEDEKERYKQQVTMREGLLQQHN